MENENIFFLLLRADANGAEVVARRIRGQLGHSKPLQVAGVDPHVFVTMVNIPEATHNESLDQLAKRVASSTEGLIKTVLSRCRAI